MKKFFTWMKRIVYRKKTKSIRSHNRMGLEYWNLYQAIIEYEKKMLMGQNLTIVGIDIYRYGDKEDDFYFMARTDYKNKR